MQGKETVLLELVCRGVKKAGRIQRRHEKRLSGAFGDRYDKALEAALSERVRKYVLHPSSRIVWSVRGKGGEYQVLPAVGFCACEDFYYGIRNGSVHLCYHLIAQRLADALGTFKTVSRGDDSIKIETGGLILER